MKKILPILIISFFLPLISLNQSLWLDEAISANVAKNFSYTEIITEFSPTDFHPPLYYLFLKSWTTFFGFGEISLRLPSVIFSLITVFLIYKLAGLWPSLFVAFNPLLIYYSGEARMYSLVVCLITGCIYALRYKKTFLFNLLSFFCIFTFYGSIFFFITLSLYFLIKKRFKDIFIYNRGIILGLIVLSPLLVRQISYSKSILLQVGNWSSVLGQTNLKNLLLIFTKFTSGRLSFYPKIYYYLVSAVWSIYCFWTIFKEGTAHKFYSFIFVFVLIIASIASIFVPMLQYFRFLYLIPVLSLIISKDQKVIPIGFLAFSLVYLLVPQFHREDWRSLSLSLQPSDNVYLISSVSDPFTYYRPYFEFRNLKELKFSENKVTIIPYATDIHGIDYKKALEDQQYHFVSQSDFRGLFYQTWSK